MSLKSVARQLSNRNKSYKTPKGAIGYDNARENIDPHIKTKVVNTKEFIGQQVLCSGLISGATISSAGTISGQDLYVAGRAGVGSINNNYLSNVQGAGGIFRGKTTTAGTQVLMRLLADDDGDVFRVTKNADDNTYVELYDGAGNIDIRLYTAGDSWINGGQFGVGTTIPHRILQTWSTDLKGIAIGIQTGATAISFPYQNRNPGGAFSYASTITMGQSSTVPANNWYSFNVYNGLGGAISTTDVLILRGDNTTTISGQLLFGRTGEGLAHGSLYIHSGAAFIPLTQNEFIQLSGALMWSNGNSNNVTLSGCNLVLDKPGTYSVNWSISAKHSGNNEVIDIDIFKNGVDVDDGTSSRKYGTAGDIGNQGATALISGAQGDYFDLRACNQSGDGDLTVYDANINIIQIAG